MTESFIIDGAFNGLVTEPVYPVDGREIVEQFLHGGVRIVHSSVVTDLMGPTSFEGAIDAILEHDAVFDAYPESTTKVDSYAAAVNASGGDRLGIVYHFQGASAIGSDLDKLAVLHRLGLRILQVTYNEENLLGCGGNCPTDTGLTSFGRKVVRACNQLGVLLDVSHVGPKTALDVVEHSDKPVVASHSNAATIYPHSRNLSDELIRAIAASRGLIGVCPHAVFTGSATGRESTLDDFIRHISHIAELTDTSNLGLASDRFAAPNFYSAILKQRRALNVGSFWTGVSLASKHVHGFRSWSEIENLESALRNVGFSSDDLAKIRGENFLRVYGDAWPAGEHSALPGTTEEHVVSAHV